MRITTKRLILDLLSTAPQRGMQVSALIVAAELFGISENNLRVSLARLRVGGLVDGDDRGRYRLADRSASVGRQVTGWREVEQRLCRWTGAWIGAHTAAVLRSQRRSHRHSARALRFLGFEEFDNSLYLRPDNLRDGIDGVRERLVALGLDAKALVYRISDLDGRAEERARNLWDTAALRFGYRASLAELEKSERRLGKLPLHSALVESFSLGGRVLKQIVLDPLLPEPLVPARERQALVEAMSHYDRSGRACWASFLQKAIRSGETAEKRSTSTKGQRGEAA